MERGRSCLTISARFSVSRAVTSVSFSHKPQDERHREDTEFAEQKPLERVWGGDEEKVSRSHSHPSFCLERSLGILSTRLPSPFLFSLSLSFTFVPSHSSGQKRVPAGDNDDDE